jgi:hypothetical protein
MMRCKRSSVALRALALGISTMANGRDEDPLKEAGPVHARGLRAVGLVFVDQADVGCAPTAGNPGSDASATVHPGPDLATLSERIHGLEDRVGRVEAVLGLAGGNLAARADQPSLLESLVRIADAIDPKKPDIVGTPYVAGRLGCTTVWVAELVRNGEIPKSCLVPGTGHGKPWKFYRGHVDRWLKSR